MGFISGIKYKYTHFPNILTNEQSAICTPSNLGLSTVGDHLGGALRNVKLYNSLLEEVPTDL